jgi:hypothetical protein
VPDYWREFLALENGWSPYVYWRRRPHQGRFINVDSNGLRATVPSGAPDTSPKIFMFGGSTTWGTGVRDEFTIPSVLARELAQRGLAATVVNFAETGWVTTQERIALELALQQGLRPDLVIFYDGINDTYSAWQQGIAGRPQNERNRFGEFNLLQRRRLSDRAQSVLLEVALSLNSRRFARHFAPRDGQDAPPGEPSGPPKSNPRLPEQVVDIYLHNLDAVQALGEHYRFATLFYWQPTIHDKVQLTPYEQRNRDELASSMKPFFDATYDVLRKRSLNGNGWPRDITKIFRETASPIFVDNYHLGEAGNEMVARSMLGDVMAELARRQSGPPPKAPAVESKSE